MISDLEFLRMRGIGNIDYAQAWAAIEASLPDCSPLDSACVANRVAKQAALEDAWVATHGQGWPEGTQISIPDLTQSQVLQFYNPADVFNSGNVVVQLPVNVNGVPLSNGANVVGAGQNTQYVKPALEFYVSSGNDAPSVGTTWKVTVHGTPGYNVSVKGGKSGAADTTVMGKIGSDKTFTLNGQFTADTVGDWNEAWYVGTELAGSISFSVKATSQQQQQLQQQQQQQQQQNQSQSNNGAPSFVDDVMVGFQSLFSPSQWGAIFKSGNVGEIVGLVAVPVLVGAFMFSGARRYGR